MTEILWVLLGVVIGWYTGGVVLVGLNLWWNTGRFWYSLFMGIIWPVYIGLIERVT